MVGQLSYDCAVAEVNEGALRFARAPGWRLLAQPGWGAFGAGWSVLRCAKARGLEGLDGGPGGTAR